MNIFRPLTVTEALNKELQRIQSEMDQYVFDGEGIKSDSPIMLIYNRLLDQKTNIQNALIDLARNQNRMF